MKHLPKVLAAIVVCVGVVFDVKLCRLNDLSDRLFIAAGRGDAREVRQLLDEGADPSRPTTMDEKTTALEAARGNGHEEVARLLESRIVKAK